ELYQHGAVGMEGGGGKIDAVAKRAVASSLQQCPLFRSQGRQRRRLRVATARENDNGGAESAEEGGEGHVGELLERKRGARSVIAGFSVFPDRPQDRQ